MHQLVFSDITVFIIFGYHTKVRSQMRNMHTPRIYTRHRHIKVLEGSTGQSKITIIIGSTWHELSRLHIFVLTPILVFGITAALNRKAHLQSHIPSVSKFSVQVDTIYTGSITITTLFNGVPLFILSYLSSTNTSSSPV